jgi:tetratricopeptide (TPR) repeat protein
MSFLFRRKKVGPEYYFERGEECLQNENYDWALESFSKAIEMNPALEMAYYHRARVYQKLGKTQEAVKDYAMFLEVDSRGYEGAGDVKELVSASIKNAQLMMQRDEVKNEIRSYGIDRIVDELMEEYDPKQEYNSDELYKLILSDLKKASPKQWHYLGFIHLIRNEIDKAHQNLDKAIIESPGDPVPHYFKGVTLLKNIEKVRGSSVVLRKEKKIDDLSLKAHSSFMQALKNGLNSKLCLNCGYKTSNPELTFCMYCGNKLAVYLFD